MRTMSCIFAIILLMAVSAQPDLTLYNATRNGAKINVCLHVVDSNGNPVQQARLRGGMQTGDRLNDFSPIEGITNTNGDYVVSGKCTHRFRCGIRKSGYDPSEISISYPIEYEANSNATYRASFSFVSEQSPGQPRHWDFLDSDSYLIFRTRTRVDEHGHLIGAHYGKILGRWMSDTEFMILSDGCFNPIENDVNLEDGTCLRDVLRNLGKKQ